MNIKLSFCITIGILLSVAACKTKDNTYNPQDDLLQLNQVQVIGSHNSYHIHPSDTIFAFLDTLGSLIPAQYNPKELDYTNVPLASQLGDYGIRGLEIDIYNDPTGGQFYLRKINQFIPINDTSFIPELLLPGFKVLHIKDVDYNSTNYTFKSALTSIKTWSDAHPNHLPIFINIETKEDGPAQNATLAGLGFQPATPFDASACDNIDLEIKSVFGNNLDHVLTPDKIRNGLPTLNYVVVQKKWPKLGQCRGKVVFIMEGPAAALYPTGHPSLQGRAMFIYANQGTPEAAFLIMNDAVGQIDSIKARVRDGYIVRTRSDAGTIQARSGDYSGMNAAFASGAQVTSTDYYRPDPRGSVAGSGWTNYVVKFPNGELARKNIINADTVNVESTLKE